MRRVHTTLASRRDSHHDLYGRCVFMCSWCSWAVGWRGPRMFLTYALPSSSHRPPRPRRPSRRLTQCRSQSLFRLHTPSHSAWLSQHSPNCGLTDFGSLELVFHAHSSCHRKVGVLRSQTELVSFALFDLELNFLRQLPWDCT